MVREGFEPGSLDAFAHRFGRSGRSLAQLLGVAPATYDRRVREGKPLSQDDLDRVARLIDVECAATRVRGRRSLPASGSAPPSRRWAARSPSNCSLPRRATRR